MEAAGRPLSEIFRIYNETSREPIESPVERVLREGCVVGLANHTVLRRRDDSEVAIADSAAPIKADSGALVGVVLVFRNVTRERREEERRSFLLRATAEMSSSLDYEQTLATVARLLVPAMADWCAVDMLEGGVIKRLAVAHVDPEKVKYVTDLERRYPPDPSAPTGTPKVLRTGQPELIAELSQEMIDAQARDEEHLRLIRKLALRSYIAAPIKYGGHGGPGGTTRGVLTLVRAESGRTYGPEDLEFASALAERAAIAIENAQLLREAQRLRAEAAAQRDQLTALIMAAPIGICVLRGRELVIELMNEPHRQRFGDGDRLGRSLLEFNIDATNTAMLQRVFETGEPAVGIEVPATADYAGGRQTRYVTYSVQPLRDVDGKVERIVLFVSDVTEQLTARHRLEAARAEAELASRVKDEFLAMLGHELRNPLAPIVTALQLMNLQAGSAFARERSIIERQVKHMVRMVDDLLDISRITRGKVELARQTVEVAEIVAKAIEMASPLIEQRRHEVTTAIASGLLVEGDPVRLAQVVANLLNNAAKYTNKGGHLFIGAERAEAGTGTGTGTGDQIVLTVRDDGMGIAPDMLPRIFDIFVQERQALDRAQGGLGLGLAIVRSLVALHGGRVEAHSEGLGRGSEFTVRLPALPTPSSTPVPSRGSQPRPVHAALHSGPEHGTDHPPQHPGARGERLLVVDDNTDALEVLCESLERLGYSTLRAGDGPSALVRVAKAAPEHRPTVGLLDIGLPLMDGYELARRLREVSGLHDIQLIAITGYGQPADRERSAAAGFDAHLVKPVSLESVQKVLEQLRGARSGAKT
ncbi:MAG: ATP-binding protein [Polyangia bacterium]